MDKLTKLEKEEEEEHSSQLVFKEPKENFKNIGFQVDKEPKNREFTLGSKNSNKFHHNEEQKI